MLLTAIIEMTTDSRRFAPEGCLSQPIHPFPLRFLLKQIEQKCRESVGEMGAATSLQLLRNGICDGQCSSGSQRSCIDDVVEGAKFTPGHHQGNFGALPPLHLLVTCGVKIIFILTMTCWEACTTVATRQHCQYRTFDHQSFITCPVIPF